MMRIFDSRFAYTLLLWLLLPYVFFHLYWRGRKQPEYLQHVNERFGRYPVRSNKPVIWLHTVSVGETRAAVTLVQRLRQRHPDHQILLTHTTPTGRAASQQLFGDDVIRVYLPYDYPFAVRRFLQHFRPRIGVLLETEVWFNLIHLCKSEHIPVLLLNARLSEKSAQRYGHFRKLTRLAMQQLYMIAAQTEADALRLASLGSRAVPVMGNLKFDIAPPSSQLEQGKALRGLFGTHRKILLMASTREGEEALLLEELHRVDVEHLLVVVVPRHPQRFDEVAELIRQHGYVMQRRSQNEVIDEQTQIVLGDSMGEMFAYYAACDIAFIGGSLLPFGGQNLIEACSVGKPVLLGPHTYNFAQATELAVGAGAALQMNHADELLRQATLLLLDEKRREDMGRAGLAFVQDNQGATESALQHFSLGFNDSIMRL